MAEPHERIDDLMCNGLKLIQDPSLFCFGMDAVLLSSFVRASENDQVLDLGCGNGILPVT
jgi:tRNA1Val (adenine37-N6)-methyltransferase